MALLSPSRPRSTPGGPIVLTVLILIGLLSACAASTDEVASSTPSVAPRRFDGEYRLISLTVTGEEQPLPASATIEFDTVDGRLVVQAGCNTYFGSFSLADDEAAGSASFTVPGGTSTPCPDEVANQEKAILMALADVTFWRQLPEGIELSSPTGELVILQP